MFAVFNVKYVDTVCVTCMSISVIQVYYWLQI